jgi:hypothetical protein
MQRLLVVIFGEEALRRHGRQQISKGHAHLMFLPEKGLLGGEALHQPLNGKAGLPIMAALLEDALTLRMLAFIMLAVFLGDQFGLYHD